MRKYQMINLIKWIEINHPEIIDEYLEENGKF